MRLPDWLQQYSGRVGLSALLPGAVLMCFFINVFLFFPQTAKELHLRWVQWDGAYSHSYMLLIVCCLFMLRNLRGQPLSVSRLSVAVAGLSTLLWIFGDSIQVSVLQQFSLPMLLAAFLLAVYGRHGLKLCLLPLMLLYLAIPLWELLLPPLRQMTSIVTTWGVRLLGIPAYIDGFSFTLPYGNVVIAGSCAGLSYLLMGTALASINVQVHRLTLRFAAAEVLLMAALAILGNWVRVFSLVLIAYFSEMESPLVAEHGWYGWVIFSGFFILYLWIIHHLSAKTDALSGNGVRPVDTTDWPRSLRYVLSLFFITALSLLLRQPLSEQQALSFSQPEYLLPVADTEQNITALQIGYRGYDQAELFQARALSGQLFITGRLIYQNQRQGKELIADGQQFSLRNTFRQGEIQLADGQPVRYEVLEGRSNQLVLMTYLIGGRSIHQPVQAKLAQFPERFKGRNAVALWFAVIDCQYADCRQQLKDIPLRSDLSEALQALALY